MSKQDVVEATTEVGEGWLPIVGLQGCRVTGVVGKEVLVAVEAKRSVTPFSCAT